MAKLKVKEQEIDWSKIEIGLSKYKEIMALYKLGGKLSKNEEFQKKYNRFYRMGRRSGNYYRDYYLLFEKMRTGKKFSITDVLSILYSSEGRKELSFSSKMLATIDPKLPIWDWKVRKQINAFEEIKLKATYKSIEECVEGYNTMLKWYGKFMKSEQAKKMIAEFDSHFPNQKITSIKKVDFIFWQTK